MDFFRKYSVRLFCTTVRKNHADLLYWCAVQASAKISGFVVARGARSAFQQGTSSSTLYSVFQRILLYSIEIPPLLHCTFSANIRVPLYVLEIYAQ